MKLRVYQDYIHVVIGIIKNTKNEVLVTKRRRDAHLGGLFEFPGGKLKANEAPKEALRRELNEELNIDLHQCSPLIQIPYTYSDRKIFLDVYIVDDYSGLLTTNEAQELRWMEITTLSNAKFPSANHGIIRALQLPKIISVTPNLSQDPDSFFRCFKNVVADEDIEIIHLRSHELCYSKYMQLAGHCLQLCKQNRTKLVLNREPKCLQELEATGLHLSSKRLLAAKERPLGKDYLVSASCHNSDEVLHASKIGLDYIFLGPVVEKHLSTNNNHLGWNNFAALVQESLIPVYAIGGLHVDDVKTAVKHGGQGIAAIRDLWTAN